MILEHALLPVRPDLRSEFEAAFARAQPLVAGMPGFRSLRLSRCLEDDDTYLLLVEWDTLEDHTVGFRGSPEYQEWRSLLHSSYDPFPELRPVPRGAALRDRGPGRSGWTLIRTARRRGRPHRGRRDLRGRPARFDAVAEPAARFLPAERAACAAPADSAATTS